MAKIICKSCGGIVIPYDDDPSVGSCDSCGNESTIPNIATERAQRLRNLADDRFMAKDFDEAYNIYNRIINEYPEDYQSYFDALLSHYGIEYVKDYYDGEYKPTIHRMQYQPMKLHPYYSKIRELVFGYPFEVIDKKATAIDKITERYIQIQNSQTPYDVFISYKETDAAGRRTADSYEAEKIYNCLTQRGKLKVFFSRETLKSIAGEEYEPYIFSALNSAKVMIVYGSNADNIKSTWVKNEWQRFSYLQRNDSGKHLIPVLLNVEPKDLEGALSRFEAFDYGMRNAHDELLSIVNKYFL